MKDPAGVGADLSASFCKVIEEIVDKSTPTKAGLL